MSKYSLLAVVLPLTVALDASSQEIEAIAHTSASNPAATTESKTTTTTKATASAPKSNTSNAATANQSTPATKDEGTTSNQLTSPSVNASSKRGAKRTKISDMEGAVFSPMALVAINEIIKNHMEARIQADRVSIALEMATGDRIDKEIKKSESERATAEALVEVFNLYGRTKAERIMDFIFNESHKAIQKAEETAQELQLALSESRERILKLENRILELQMGKIEKEQAE
ncbi:hypothetical protein RhiJN_22012 [Ceratobasidium sp. AG-Ba]|nr:hypothetical protein RhiJN_22012 [Ceratobasidium sp. AG-Ba]